MRYCEDRLEDAIRRGFQQYVILGAGMDTFCHRRPDLVSDLRVIEVDLPASQQMKRERLAAARSEEHTSELQSLMRISYAVFCVKKKKPPITSKTTSTWH